MSDKTVTAAWWNDPFCLGFLLGFILGNGIMFVLWSLHG